MFFPASPTKQTRRRSVAEEKKTGETICRDGETPARGSDNFSGARGDGSAFRRVLQMAADGAGMDVEQSGGGAAVVLRVLEQGADAQVRDVPHAGADGEAQGDDGRPVGLGRVARGGAEGRRVRRFRGQVRLDDLAFAEHDGALENVIELADVPRPVVSQ